MKYLFRTLFILFFLILMFYVCLPSPDFPKPPADSLQSKEMADIETPLRRAYFTNFTREEVLKHYQDQFKGYLLNYPPEEGQTLIRDQTKSTFLQEIVHPLRESIYINGYEPKEPQHAINIGNRPWRQKIIIKYVPSNIVARVTVVLLSAVLTYFLAREWLISLKND